MSQNTSEQTYTTKQVCEIAQITQPRIHQMRNGQSVKAPKTGQIYKIKPTLEEGKHWRWNGSEVVFLPAGLEAVLNRRTKAPSAPKEAKAPKAPKEAKKPTLVVQGSDAAPRKRGRPRKVQIEQPVQAVETAEAVA